MCPTRPEDSDVIRVARKCYIVILSLCSLAAITGALFLILMYTSSDPDMDVTPDPLESIDGDIDMYRKANRYRGRIDHLLLLSLSVSVFGIQLIIGWFAILSLNETLLNINNAVAILVLFVFIIPAFSFLELGLHSALILIYAGAVTQCITILLLRAIVTEISEITGAKL